jgi:4-diphosphocytidyl-2-C-methyl-D-erythritol kinase
MPSAVRSYSKINLGLAIGPPRPDGFHALATLYQTIAMHDIVTVAARPAERTRIQLTSSDPRVPRDERNTAWKMVAGALHHMRIKATINIRIQKNLPVQGGMGAGSANAAAALIGLERELGIRLSDEVRLRLASDVGSDVPLFLVGGSVLGTDRGQVVTAVPDVTLNGSSEIACVIALPEIGVSTPDAFRDWDALVAAQAQETGAALHLSPKRDILTELSRHYASVFGSGDRSEEKDSESGTSGILPDLSSAVRLNDPEKQQGFAREQLHASQVLYQNQTASRFENDFAANSLAALVGTGVGIENDFETVVFPRHPVLRDIKQLLVGSREQGSAAYAALSGSGSALFGLYWTKADATAAQQRLQHEGVRAIVTATIPRSLYWNEMFAE